MLDLNQMTLADLKILAKENNIKNISKLKKEELIIILNQVISSDKKIESNMDNIKLTEEKEPIERHYDENG